MSNFAADMARKARDASSLVATLPAPTRNAVLLDLAASLESNAASVASANTDDVSAARAAALPDAKIRRLTLTAAAIHQMIAGLRQVADLPDPVGEVTADYRVPSGLQVRRVRCPLGVILMIYEARPNVTIDAFGLCFKSGNACILKGGREAARTNQALIDLARAALARNHAPIDAAALITSSDRDEMKALLQLHELIDLVIPRGGTDLIRFVHENSHIPIVQHFMGVCHIYVDAAADPARAIEICATAKTSAPSACNAVETILVHQAAAPNFIPQLVARMQKDGVEVRADAAARGLAPSASPAADDDFGREFLDLIVALKIVPNLDAAIDHIHRHGSNHTEAILSSDPAACRRFVEQVQSSCVLVNASTRFNDGFQLGLGAEIGISTSRIHAYGPMGLRELTSQRYVVHGDGQAR